MSFFKSMVSHTETPIVKMRTTYSHLEKVTSNVKGFLVEDYQFIMVDVTNDERKGLTYQYYSMSNLQALGVDGQLKMCVVAADNFKIADAYENLVKPKEVPAENN